MNKTGQRWKFDPLNEHQVNAFLDELRLRWSDGKTVFVEFFKPTRSYSQNTMAFALYRQIADEAKKSMVEVKAECKLRFGVVIRKSDPEWAELYDSAIKPMSYENKLLLMQEYPITSGFTKEQFGQYLDTIIEEYTKQGYNLDDPRFMNAP